MSTGIDAVKKHISRYVKPDRLSANEEGNILSFQLRMIATPMGRTTNKYILSGKVSRINNETTVDYYLYPAPITMFISIILICSLLHGGVLFVQGHHNLLYVLVSFVLNVLFFLLIAWEEKCCTKKFEEKMRDTP